MAVDVTKDGPQMSSGVQTILTPAITASKMLPVSCISRNSLQDASTLSRGSYDFRLVTRK
jgi:hypothetical protein